MFFLKRERERESVGNKYMQIAGRRRVPKLRVQDYTLWRRVFRACCKKRIKEEQGTLYCQGVTDINNETRVTNLVLFLLTTGVKTSPLFISIGYSLCEENIFHFLCSPT